jgi:DNA-binding beta-propeller fold protein YncE
VSPDGKSVYVASSDALVRLNRNPTTGAITQPAGPAGCISETGAGICADGHALGAPNSVAVSADGKSVYASSVDGGVARLKRNTTTGAITQPAGTAGCISDDGRSADGPGTCADGHGIYQPSDLDVSPDGKSVYVIAFATVARLNRNPTTGAITQPAGTAGCISEIETGWTCADGHGILVPWALAVSPDGKNVYVTSSLNSHAVARFNRNTTTGAISQPAGPAGCISNDGSSGECSVGNGLYGPSDLDVSSDGKSIYVASQYSDAVTRLNRNLMTGAISQPAGSAGCVSETGAAPCADGHGLDRALRVAVSPDDMSVYVASGHSDAVARFNRAP